MKKGTENTSKVTQPTVNQMIDKLVTNAEQALAEYMQMSQDQVDEIVHSMALAGLDKHMYLAKLAVEETKRGLFEDKVIKNMFST
jgi:acetaldehyde dehydrogenase/alcohol dehydrogenase